LPEGEDGKQWSDAHTVPHGRGVIRMPHRSYVAGSLVPLAAETALSLPLDPRGTSGHSLKSSR
jgi:hypothetical protein